MPDPPDDPQPSAGQDAGGVLVGFAPGRGVGRRSRWPIGEARRLSAARSVTAARSLCLQAHLNATTWWRPDWRVEGTVPASAVRGVHGGVGAAGVADLDKQLGDTNLSSAGQGCEDVPLRVQDELFFDVGFQHRDLAGDGGQRGHKRLCGRGGHVAWVAGQSVRGVGEAGQQCRGGGAAAVAVWRPASQLLSHTRCSGTRG